MDGEAFHEPKLERSRTRWTPPLDKIFADLIVKHIQLGNRPNNVFDKKTWNHIREEFNQQTDLNFNNNQLRKHLDVLRTRFHNLKSAFDQNEFTIDDSYNIGFDLWEDIEAQSRPETTKGKECPIYEQLCTIFTETVADGKYAQSSHYEELDKAAEKDVALSSCQNSEAVPFEKPSSSRAAEFNLILSEKMTKTVVERKKKRSIEVHSCLDQSNKDQEIYGTISEALLEMLSAFKLGRVARMHREDRFSITNCIRSLDEIEEIDENLYFGALDLFEEPNLRETFISLKGNKIRLRWLQGKCNLER